jgi:23S rRNA maturation mini-RNase III
MARLSRERGRKMRLKQRIAEKSRDIHGTAPVTLAFLGDSVTQGCF